MWFKKKKTETILPNGFETLVSYIVEATEKNIYSPEQIREKFREKGYSDDVTLIAFQEAIKKIDIKKTERRDKMAKEQEEYDEDYEEEDESPEEPEEEVEEEQPKPKKKEDKEGDKEEPKIDINQVLANFDMRIQNLESKLFRMLSA